jgi:hypothetical protein
MRRLARSEPIDRVPQPTTWHLHPGVLCLVFLYPRRVPSRHLPGGTADENMVAVSERRFDFFGVRALRADSSGTRPIPLKQSFRLFRRLLHQKTHLRVGSLQING